MKKCEATAKCIAVNYKQGRLYMDMTINNMDKPNIIMLDASDDTASRVEIFA